MPDLKRGSTGSEVKKLQVYLGVEPANGNFGPITETALKDWQKKNGQAETGIATTDTIVALSTEYSNKLAVTLAEKYELSSPDGSLGQVESYEKLYEAAFTGDYAAYEAARVSANDNTQQLANVQPAEGSVESGIYDIDSLIAAMLNTGAPTQATSPAATVEQTTNNIANTQNILNTANNTTQQLNQQIQKSETEVSTAVNTVNNNQSRVIQNAENVNTMLTGPTVTAIQNKTEQSQALTSALSATTNINQTQNATAPTTTISDASRVENTQLITKSETSQIINPPNPVVGAVETMETGVKREIQNMSTDLSTNISNIKSGDNVANSQVTQVDQSSIYNTVGEKPNPQQVELEKGKAAEPENNTNLNEIYLAAIYEALVAGIKVKIST